MSDYLFSYGTLLPQHSPPEIRSAVRALSAYAEGSVAGVMFDLGEFPGAVLEESSASRVYGMVFHLPKTSEVLNELDRYEGYDPSSPDTSLFVRRRCPVRLVTGRTIDCWVYEYNGSHISAPIVASGRYRKGDVAAR